jgi:outer membrane lipoprotein SlyB
MGILTGIAGALGGALLGNVVERSVSGGGGTTEFIVERDDGQIVTIPQAGPTDLRTGDRVAIVNDRGRPRLVRAVGGGPAGPGAPPMPGGPQAPLPQEE